MHIFLLILLDFSTIYAHLDFLPILFFLSDFQNDKYHLSNIIEPADYQHIFSAKSSPNIKKTPIKTEICKNFAKSRFFLQTESTSRATNRHYRPFYSMILRLFTQ